MLFSRYRHYKERIMRKFMDQIPKFVVVALAAFCILDILFYWCGYRLVPLGGEILFLLLALLLLIGAIWLRAHAHWRHFKLERNNHICTILIPPLAFVAFLCSVISQLRLTFILPLATILLVTISAGLLLRTGNVAAGLCHIVLSLPALWICFFGILFWNFGVEYRSAPVPSPDGKYTAQVIISDQGALGEETYIAVTHGMELHFGLFTLEPLPERIYIPDHYEHTHIHLTWEDNTSVRIDNSVYKVVK